MRKQLDMKIDPQIFLHQNNAEKHLAQSINQCGGEKNEQISYTYFFKLDHISKIKFSFEVYDKSLIFLMNFII